jgi:uncharacterized protein
MSEKRHTISGIVCFLALTFALSSIFYRAILRETTLSSALLVYGLMWSPGVAGLITRLIFQRTLRGVGWGARQWKYLWQSYWIPIVYSAAEYLPLWAAGYGDFRSEVLEKFAAFLHMAAMPRVVIVAAYIGVTGTLGLIVSCVGTTGEELGWRGFLVPELAKVTSFRRLSLISAAVWLAWHLPVILGADYHGAGPQWYSILCFALLVLGTAFLWAWMRLKSGSFWTGVILHTSHNVFVQRIFNPLTRPAPLTNYLIGEFGAGLAIVGIVLAFLFWRKQNELTPPPAST